MQGLLDTFNAVAAPKEFAGSWQDILPMDQQMPDWSMGQEFTEVWLDLDDAPKAMKRLREYFSRESENLMRTGSFAWEFYTAPASEFWMSPAYNRNVFRIDIFWYVSEFGCAADFYQQFWWLLE